MKTIIAGSREGIDPLDFADAMAASGWSGKVTEVVSGMANGVDYFGLLWADANGIKVKSFPANWEKYGNFAEPRRNWHMATYADALILVWDGTSRGSANMLRKAQVAGIKIFEWIPERYTELDRDE